MFRSMIRMKQFMLVAAAILFLFSPCAEGQTPPVEYESGFYYTVQPGDTLWGLSERFYNSPWMWPDLWRNNTLIKNPHVLEPGMRIRLFQKQRDERTTEPGLETTSLEMKTAPELKIFFLYKEIDKIGFVRKRSVDPWGAILKVPDDKVIISKGDLIYITPAEHARFTPGDKFKIYRTLADPVTDPVTGNFIGIQHYIVGIAEVIEHESRFPPARVIESFREIKVNDKLIPHQPASPEIFITESLANMDGRVIGFEEQNRLIGNQSLAFIDKGKNDGLTKGQIYSLYREDRVKMDPKNREYAHLARFDIGSFIVLHTEPVASTVLVTIAEKEVYKGAKFGSPNP